MLISSCFILALITVMGCAGSIVVLDWQYKRDFEIYMQNCEKWVQEAFNEKEKTD